MKKLIFLFVMFLLLLVVACGDEDSKTDDGQAPNDSDNQEERVNEEENEQDQEIEENNNEQNENKDTNNDEETNEDEVSESEQEQPEKENKAPEYTLNSAWYAKPIEDADPKVVLLTIDDGPDGHALEMAATLKEHNAPAIFFVNGHFMDTEEEQEIVKELYDMGFHIGNHTYNHQNLRNLTEEEQREEIISLSELIEEVIGEKPKFFRAPHGANTDFARELVKEQGMLLMNWSYGYDFTEGYMEKEALEDIMINAPGLGKGANLLMHDREWTNAALPAILEGLKEKGYNFLDPALLETPTE